MNDQQVTRYMLVAAVVAALAAVSQGIFSYLDRGAYLSEIRVSRVVDRCGDLVSALGKVSQALWDEGMACSQIGPEGQEGGLLSTQAFLNAQNEQKCISARGMTNNAFDVYRSSEFALKVVGRAGIADILDVMSEDFEEIWRLQRSGHFTDGDISLRDKIMANNYDMQKKLLAACRGVLAD